MADFTVSPSDVLRFKENSAAEAVQICAYWKVLRPTLLLIKTLPFVPQPVKDAIDWIIKFGDLLCPGSLEVKTGGDEIKLKPGPQAYFSEIQAATGAVHIGTQSTKTTRQELWVDHANGNCTENRCIEEGGCARCGTVTIFLPKGSQVIGARYYSTAHYPDDYAIPQAIGAGQDVAWSLMEPIQVNPQGAYDLVTARYHNRSNNRARLVAVEVDYQ